MIRLNIAFSREPILSLASWLPSMMAKNPAFAVLRDLWFCNLDGSRAGCLHAYPAVWGD